MTVATPLMEKYGVKNEVSKVIGLHYIYVGDGDWKEDLRERLIEVSDKHLNDLKGTVFNSYDLSLHEKGKLFSSEDTSKQIGINCDFVITYKNNGEANLEITEHMFADTYPNPKPLDMTKYSETVFEVIYPEVDYLKLDIEFFVEGKTGKLVNDKYFEECKVLSNEIKETLLSGTEYTSYYMDLYATKYKDNRDSYIDIDGTLYNVGIQFNKKSNNVNEFDCDHWEDYEEASISEDPLA